MREVSVPSEQSSRSTVIVTLCGAAVLQYHLYSTCLVLIEQPSVRKWRRKGTRFRVKGKKKNWWRELKYTSWRGHLTITPDIFSDWRMIRNRCWAAAVLRPMMELQHFPALHFGSVEALASGTWLNTRSRGVWDLPLDTANDNKKVHVPCKSLLDFISHHRWTSSESKSRDSILLTRSPANGVETIGCVVSIGYFFEYDEADGVRLTDWEHLRISSAELKQCK